MLKNWIFLFTSHSLVALTTLNVMLSTDNNPGGFGEMGDLRYCLNTMNQDLNMMPDDYEIHFDFPMTIQLNGNLPLINNSPYSVNIAIGNSGSIPTVTIDGNSGAYNGFFIPMGNVTIQNMIFQNLCAKGGNGGDGISGGGGGLGAGGAIYTPQVFLNGSFPSVTLMNVSINSCSAIGGNGGGYMGGSSTGNEGGGGGGGFAGNGGSVTTTGTTGGAGGGGFGGDGGDVTLSDSDVRGPGGGGGGGIGSRATIGVLDNLGLGGQDQGEGTEGNAYGLTTASGAGAGGHPGKANAGGGGGGGAISDIGVRGGGGGGSSFGDNGLEPLGSIPPGGSATPSGGNGKDGGGGGGGGVVATSSSNAVSGQAGSGGYGGGGGGGAGTGAYDVAYTVRGGSGGMGGGGGGGGVDQSDSTPAGGGDSGGGGGGGGGGTASSSNPPGGIDLGALGGGAGGVGNNNYGAGFGGGGGGGGSGLGGAIFVDTGLNLTIQALPGIPTVFNTINTTTQAGLHGTGGMGAEDGADGTALGNSIFLRTGASLTLVANDTNDLLTLGDGVAFVDDTDFGAGGTIVLVEGDGTIVYNGSTDYQGTIIINNANLKVNGNIDRASISVCRNSGFSAQRGQLSGVGTMTGDVFVNSGTISPDAGGILTLGSLTLSPASPMGSSLGSLVHITIDLSGTSKVSVNGPAALAGTLEIDLDPSITTGTYTILEASSIMGAFDSVAFTGTPHLYSLFYHPTYVEFALRLSEPDPILPTQGLSGNSLRVANYLNAIGLTNQLQGLPYSEYQNALKAISPARNAISTFAAQNVLFMFSGALSAHFTKERLSGHHSQNLYANETALVAAAESPRSIMYAPSPNTSSQIWGMGFGALSHQNSQNQTPAFDFTTGGFFAAYDYGNTDQGCIGALAGYAYTTFHEHDSQGNGRINAGYLSLYGMRTFSDFFIDAAIWGEYMSVDQKRHITFPGYGAIAKSSFHAKQFDLHFGTGYDFNIRTATIEPFALLDWVFERDPAYSEKDAAPYNMRVSARSSGMLRLETGLNGYNTSTFSWGVFIVQGKLSYVYKKPHHVGHLHAAILGAPASFTVSSFTSTQSLISPAIELFWRTNWNGYGSISYDGEFGSGYNSNQFYGKIGYAF